jgi:hypothetical protein
MLTVTRLPLVGRRPAAGRPAGHVRSTLVVAQFLCCDTHGGTSNRTEGRGFAGELPQGPCCMNCGGADNSKMKKTRATLCGCDVCRGQLQHV